MLRRARALRATSTGAEAALWECLRARRLCGLKFRRQHPVDRFVTDFYCHEVRLVVELDGGIHGGRDAEDEARTRCIEGLGARVIRFRNGDVTEDLPGVLARILSAADETKGVEP
jgi:very-short-patch-repair endonuclease